MEIKCIGDPTTLDKLAAGDFFLLPSTPPGDSGTFCGEQGSILQLLPLDEAHAGLLVILEEDVRDKLTTALRFASSIIDRVDESERLSNVVVVVSLNRCGLPRLADATGARG